MDRPRLRIGALSQRVGVSPELLRAWEQRYGLLEPVRSDGGFRLYSTADEERVRSMQRHLEAGVSAAQAAQLALAETSSPSGGQVQSAELAPLASQLRAALDRFDEAGANAVLDRVLATFTLETVLRDVVLVYLRELGERWEHGDASIAQEHFASNLLRGRLLGIARGWGRGSGPVAVLACAPGELHDLPLIVFGLVLARRGWAIAYLGPDTPVATIRDSLARVEPDLVVISATATQGLRAAEAELTELARVVELAVAGAGADSGLARSIGATLIDGDPVTAAERISAERR